MADHIYDLIIIGAGPAGYTAALRAAAMGMDAVLIEKKALGILRREFEREGKGGTGVGKKLRG